MQVLLKFSRSAPPPDRARLKVHILLDIRIRYVVLVVSFVRGKNISKAPPPDRAHPKVNILLDVCIRFVVDCIPCRKDVC